MRISKIFIFVFIFLVLTFSVYAEDCVPKKDLFNRLTDSCRSNDNICNDAETPFEKDCNLSTSIFECKSGSRCAFDEIWLAKLIIIIFLGVLWIDPDKYKYFALGLAILLLVNYGFNGVSNISFLNNSTLSDSTIVYAGGNVKELAPVVYYGSKILPNNPVLGFFGAILLIVFLIYQFLRVDNAMLVKSIRGRK